MSEFDSSKNRRKAIEISNTGNSTDPNANTIPISITLDGTNSTGKVYEITFVKQEGENNYALKLSNGNYLYCTAEKVLKESEDIKEGCIFNVSKSQKYGVNVWDLNVKVSNDNYHIGYGGTSVVNAYKTTTNTATFLYKKDVPSFTIGKDKFATFYSDKAYIMPEGVTGGTITAADTESGKLTINYVYTAGTTVPAKTALLLKGEQKTYTYSYATTTSGATAPAGNLLHGADAVNAGGKTYVEGTNVKYYILSHSTDDAKKLGFYWAAANGAAITYQAPYAFLAFEAGTGGSAPTLLSIDGDDDTTAINGITTDRNNDNIMYNLAGQRVNANAKGIIIMNGKKIIKK